VRHDLYTINVTYDGEDFIFKKFKQPVLKTIFENADFTGDEPLPSCLAHHINMGGPELIAVSDTRFLWKISFGRKCKDQTCPITKMYNFALLVEQDFLICSGEGQGLTWNRPKVEITSESDTESDTGRDDFDDFFND